MPTATASKPKTKKAKKAKLSSKAKTIHMGVLLDESGSMAGNAQAVIDGTNEFVGSLTKEKNAGKARITVACFDDRDPMVRFPRVGEKLSDWTPITEADYAPCGLTPLYDSIARIITEIEGEKGEDDKALIVIFTDGLENASREFDAEKIKSLIAEKEKKGFDFIYLGANVDAKMEGGMLGLKQPGSSLNFASTPKGTRSATRAASGMAMSYLASGGDYGAVAAANVSKFGDTIDEDDDTGNAPPKQGTSRASSVADKARSALK